MYGKGDIQKVFFYLGKATDDSIAVGLKYDMMADVMIDRGKIKDAISVYERSLKINSGQRKTRLNLIRIKMKRKMA